MWTITVTGNGNLQFSHWRREVQFSVESSFRLIQMLKSNAYRRITLGRETVLHEGSRRSKGISRENKAKERKVVVKWWAIIQTYRLQDNLVEGLQQAVEMGWD